VSYADVQGIVREMRQAAEEQAGVVKRQEARRYVLETFAEMAGATLQGACWATGAMLAYRAWRR
jgi:hypothetical protein